MIKTWRLDDGRQTMVLASSEDRLPEVIYWGAPLPADENLMQVAAATQLDVTGGMLDRNPDLSICPEAARSFPGQPGLILSRSNTGTPLATSALASVMSASSDRTTPLPISAR